MLEPHCRARGAAAQPAPPGTRSVAALNRQRWAEWSQVAGAQHHLDRFPLMRLVQYELSAARDLAPEGAGITVNVSSGGLCLLLDWAPPVQEVLRVHVPMPATLAQTPTLAEVRWVRPLPFTDNGAYFVGLRFLL